MAALTPTRNYNEPSRCWDDLPGGLYYLENVARYLRATDHALWPKDISLSPEQIEYWGERGFFEVEENEYMNNRRFIEFSHLITMRLIALLLSDDIAEDKIVSAQNYAKITSGDIFPFATRIFWTDEPDGTSGIYARFHEILAASNGDGEIPFARLMNGHKARTFGMEFDGSGRAISWEPSDGVEIHPGFLSGAPRIKNRRIHADQISGMIAAGQTKEFMRWWLEITESQIEDALRWEEKLNQADLVAST